MSNIHLETRNVGDIKGKFKLPDYQRGYRWGALEINLMLDDLYESGNKSYCLQPIVVKKINDDYYELIDGQQRLTTIFLIYKYFNYQLGRLYRPKFSLKYETRKKSEAFLEEIIDEDKTNNQRLDNIDFFYISNAYKCICDYFQKGGSADEVEPPHKT